MDDDEYKETIAFEIISVVGKEHERYNKLSCEDDWYDLKVTKSVFTWLTNQAKIETEKTLSPEGKFKMPRQRPSSSKKGRLSHKKRNAQ